MHCTQQHIGIITQNYLYVAGLDCRVVLYQLCELDLRSAEDVEGTKGRYQYQAAIEEGNTNLPNVRSTRPFDRRLTSARSSTPAKEWNQEMLHNRGETELTSSSSGICRWDGTPLSQF
jgi:hypothetical protein